MENFNKNNELYGSLIQYDAPRFGPGYAFNADGRKIGEVEADSVSANPFNTSTEATVGFASLSPLKIFLGVAIIAGAGFGLYKLLN